MASLAQLSNFAETALGGRDGSATTQQDVASYTEEGGLTGDASHTMKALTWQGKNKVQVRDMPRPVLLESRDVILKVTGTTICGSDLHLLHGAVVQMKPNDILGHEFCGIADEVGPDAKGIKKGQRYVASFQIGCGECFFCKQKLSSQCTRTNASASQKALYGGQTAGIFGYSHFTGGFAGGQAEYVRVPYGDVNLLAIPDGVPDEKALYLSDVLCTSFNAVQDTAVYKDDEVAVFGAGPIGQMAGLFALRAGASRVVFVDTEPRLSFVKSRWPSEHADKFAFIDFSKLSFGVTNKETVVSRLKAICRNGLGPDVALECAAGEYAKGWLHWVEMQLGVETDTSEILNEMIEGVRNYGRVGVTGVYVGYTNHFNIGSIMERGIRLIGNGQAPVHKYWKDLLQMVQKNEIDPRVMLSHRVRLADMEHVYHAFDKREDGMQKVFVETKFSQPRAPGTPELTIYS